jgi:hypothetical protein
VGRYDKLYHLIKFAMRVVVTTSEGALGSVERRCIDLLTRFYFALDCRAYDEAVSPFAADGTWIRFGEPLVGAAAIRKKLDQRPANVNIRHILSNLHFTSVGDAAAHSRGYVTVYVHPYDGAAQDCSPIGLDSLLVLDTDYTRTPDGWRIRKHDGVFVMKKPT